MTSGAAKIFVILRKLPPSSNDKMSKLILLHRQVLRHAHAGLSLHFQTGANIWKGDW